MNPWNVYAHSVTGQRHLRDRKANQDRYRFWTERGRPVMVLGDGAGSKDRAGEGAEIAVVAAGCDIVAYSCTEAAKQLTTADLPTARQMLEPVFAEAFTRVNKGILRGASATRDAAESFSVSLTATIIERRWLGCITEGDVAVVSGRPNGWKLVNSIFKAEEPGRPGSRNATKLLPYRTTDGRSDGTSTCDFAARAPGDLTLMFCDGALSAFLRDTQPTAPVGSYAPIGAALDQFYLEFSKAVAATRSPPPRFPRLHALRSTLFGKPPPVESPDQVIARWIEAIVRSGESDDITIIAALD